MAITSLNNRELLRKSKRNGSMGRDWISKLPDELLCKILSCLSTKNSVRTSVLSRRWRNLWSAVPTLDLKTSKFEDDDDFWDFFDGFMESNKDLDLKRFKLVYNIGEHTHGDFVSRIDEVVKRKVCHLTILNMGGVEYDFVRMPLSLYSCATLVKLELYSVLFDAPGSALVSLPCVKTMTLKGVMFDGDQVLTNLISRCPVLEELFMVTHPGEQLKVICVRSRSLKSFKLESTCGEDCDVDEHPGDPQLLIFAPRLEYMSVCDYQTDSCIIRKIGKSAKVEIDLVLGVDYDDPSERTMMRNFLTSISSVGEMIISGRSLQMIDDYRKLEPLPQFSNLYWLQAFSLDNSWEVLQTFLGYCPNLHSLHLDFKCLPEPEAINLSYVPPCFLSSLEYVELRTVVKASDKKLATYFQRNCVVLKELRVLNKILGIPKRSRECQIGMLKAY